MWGKDSRDSIWSNLEHPWDVIVIGGGITGAGIFNYAARAGLRVLLAEANDYAFGGSGRSGKWVGQTAPNATLALERERLLRNAPLLARPEACYRAVYQGEKVAFGQRMPAAARDVRAWAPHLREDGLRGARVYEGAAVDDARLVLRLIREGVACGGVALNYARAEQLLISARGQVCGVVLRDRAQGEDGRTAEVQARAVVNAAGPWCDGLRAKQGGKPLLREKSGSHLFLSLERLSLAGGIALPHPRDGRELRFIPWEGVVAVGATDQDYYLPEDVAEPAVSAQEVEYLLEGLAYAFPGLELGIRDVIAGHAGVMVLAEGGGLVLDESGLVTAAGGMLATFRVTAAQALNLLRERLPGLRPFEPGQAVLEMPGEMPYSGVLDPAEWSYLAGRYGRELPGLLAATPPEELTPIYPHLPFLWAELRWAARDGAVVHLDDLLLRRLRLGLQVRRGGVTEMEDLRPFIQPELDWDNIRWQWEVARYARIRELYYAV